jgi:hypothetical protein
LANTIVFIPVTRVNRILRAVTEIMDDRLILTNAKVDLHLGFGLAERYLLSVLKIFTSTPHTAT